MSSRVVCAYRVETIRLGMKGARLVFRQFFVVLRYTLELLSRKRRPQPPRLNARRHVRAWMALAPGSEVSGQVASVTLFWSVSASVLAPMRLSLSRKGGAVILVELVLKWKTYHDQ